MFIIKIIFNIFFVLFVSLLWCNDLFLSVDKISILYQISLTVSTILFGVLGIWISSVYNTSLTSFEFKDTESSEKSLAAMDYLINPLIFSVVNIVFCILFYIISSILDNMELSINLKVNLLKVSTYICYYFLLLQCWFVLSVFSPFFRLKLELKKMIKIKEITLNRLKVNKKK